MSLIDLPDWNHHRFGHFVENSRITIVGFHPYESDIKAQRPWSGSSGSLLTQCANHAGVMFTECTQIFLADTPENEGTSLRIWNPKAGFTVQGSANIERLEEYLSANRPNVVITLGEACLQALTGLRGITKWRGSILESTLVPGLKVIPTLDPASAMKMYIWRYFISYDFKRAHEESYSPEIKLPQRNIITFPTFNEVMTYLQNIIDNKTTVASDIETSRKRQITCISFAVSPSSSISIPFIRSSDRTISDYWTLEEEAQILLKIAEVWEDPLITKKFQNGMFDMFFMLHFYGIHCRGPIEDTMVKHALNYPDFPKNLGFINSIYTREPYYKDEGKEAFKSLTGIDLKRYFTYNAKDSAVTYEADAPITAELAKAKNLKTWEFNQQLFAPLLYMQARGILIDENKLISHRAEAQKKQDELQFELNQLVGFHFNTNSPMQCKEYFYTTKKFRPLTKKVKQKDGTKKEVITCDTKALRRIARNYNCQEARLVQSIRGYRKLIGTYLNVTYDEDKRLRCSFNIGGTVTGRLSSSETCYGTGTNLQNLPKIFKEFLIADPGFIMVELDKAQAEWVATAYICGDVGMISAIEKREDVHIHTANMMFGIPKDLIKLEDKSIGTLTDEASILEIRKEKTPAILDFKNILPNMSCRQAGKKCNHSFNYGLSPQGFSLQYEMELPYAKRCYTLYHNAYPGIRVWHSYIERKLGEDRVLENLFGRRRRFYGRWSDDLFKAAYAFNPQSSVGELLNRGIVLSYYQQYDEDAEFLRPLDALNQVHDSVLFQYPIARLGGLALAILRYKQNLEPQLYCNGREFTIRTDCKIGYNNKQMIEIDIDCNEHILYQNLVNGIAKLEELKPQTIDIEEILDEESTEEENL